MAAIIEADIIENPHGDVVQIGDDQSVPFVWIWTAGADINASAPQNVYFYRIGNVVHFYAAANGTGAPAGWHVGATGVAATIESKALYVVPAEFRPLTTRLLPIAVETNAAFSTGTMQIDNTGKITIGATTTPSPLAAFTVAVAYGFQLRGSYII